MKRTGKQLPRWAKQTIAIAGLLLTLPGLLLAFGFFCITLILLLDGESEALTVGLVGFILTIAILGAGGAACWHGIQSLHDKPSKSIALPPLWLLFSSFGLAILLGFAIDQNEAASVLFFPFILLITAASPPLLALAWFARQNTQGLTWRRGLLAFAGGATVSVLIAVILEILFPGVILALIFDPEDVIWSNLQDLGHALVDVDIASALIRPGFVYVFIQFVLIRPLIEALAKPLVTLPLLGYLSRREAFLVGAMAGAGFATLENMVYGAVGFPFWGGILLMQALGGAIHPVGAGLVALGWQEVLSGQAGAWPRWLKRSGLAAGLHALWNGGSLLVIGVAWAGFSTYLPIQIDGWGILVTGLILAFLIALGLTALWLGYKTALVTSTPNIEADAAPATGLTLSDQAAAVWAIICLSAITPIGILGWQLWMR
jgi:hypothetical protein